MSEQPEYELKHWVRASRITAIEYLSDDGGNNFPPCELTVEGLDQPAKVDAQWMARNEPLVGHYYVTEPIGDTDLRTWAEPANTFEEEYERAKEATT